MEKNLFSAKIAKLLYTPPKPKKPPKSVGRKNPIGTPLENYLFIYFYYFTIVK